MMHLWLTFVSFRSAMDDFYSVEKFRKAGADANITKDSHVTQILEELKQQYQLQLQMAHLVRTSLEPCNQKQLQ